jgi:hypothetical protein
MAWVRRGELVADLEDVFDFGDLDTLEPLGFGIFHREVSC